MKSQTNKTTIDNVTCFVFPADVCLQTIIGGNDILDWMDEQIAKSPFIDINLIELRQTEDKCYRFVYEVAPREKINCEYAVKHLAFRAKEMFSKN